MKFIEQTKGVAENGEEYHVLIDESGNALPVFPSIQESAKGKDFYHSLGK